MVSTAQLDEITHRLVEHFHPDKIILFGSCASGRADEGSDVDLLVVAETNLPPQQRFPEARRLLADLPFGFDILVRTPDEYRRRRNVINHIVYFAEKYGKVLYER